MATHWNWFRGMSLLAGLGAAGLVLAAGAGGPATRGTGEALDAATRVTLKAEAPARTLFANLGRQSGITFHTMPADLWEKRSGPDVSVSLQGVTFWSAMRELCQKAGVTMRIVGDGQMLLSSAPPGARQWVNYPSSESGPFMVVAQTITRDHQADLARGDEVSRGCTLTMSVYAEPRLKVLKVAPTATVNRAVDERGNSLAGGPPALRNSPQVLSGGQWVWTVTATLASPVGAGRTIASLKGTVMAVAQSRAATAEVDRILEARSVARAIGGHRLLIKDVRAVGTGYTVLATITRDPATGEAWQEMAAGNMLRLVDAQGRSLTRRGYTQRWGNAQSMDLSLTFGREDFQVGAQVGEPARLIWEVPMEVQEIQIPFEFAELPLP